MGDPSGIWVGTINTKRLILLMRGSNPQSPSKKREDFIMQKLIYCSGHGISQIMESEEKSIGSQVISFINTKVLTNGLKISIPENNKNPKYREILTKKQINKIYDFLKEQNYKPDMSTWNRRNRDYIQKLQSLDVFEVASVLRDIVVLENHKKLSFGERKTKEQALKLLADEIHCVTKEPLNHIKENLSKSY